MPDLPEIPGKGLVAETTKRAWVLAGAAAVGVAGAGAFLLRRVLGHGTGDAQDGNADPIAETPTSPPGEEIRLPDPKSVKPKPRKAEGSAPKAKPAKPKVAKSKPAKSKAKPAPSRPESEPGNISAGKDPHHALNNPVVDPDETEYPDPFDKREDPRAPVDPDGMSFGDGPRPPTGAGSTSEPHPGQDPEAGDRAEPPKRENLDD
jgi:hypothetical protein